MQYPSYLRVLALGAALFLAVGLLSGVAQAQGLNLGEQKCVNTANKNAQKIGDAQGKDISACVKDFAKARNQSAEACSTSDPKGKVGKAENGYDSKVNKDCAGGSGFINLASNADVKAAAVDKELDIINMIFTNGMDASSGGVIKEVDNKTDSKCQQALVKAIYKCQATKWKAYNSCKKNKLKGKDTSAATSALDLQEACMNDPQTGGIPDGKGKISRKCDFSGTISKMCPNPNVFPGCPGASLNTCLDVIVECNICLALNEIDGLNRNCDDFDDGQANGSCGGAVCGNDVIEAGEDCEPPGSTCTGGENCLNCICVPQGSLGTHMSELDASAICEGGANNGQECTDVAFHSDCPDGLCIAVASSLIIANPLFGEDGVEIVARTVSTNEITCGEVDPEDGTASCTIESLGVEGSPIFPIGHLCFLPRPDLNCPTGLIDCDGGTPMDQQVMMHHNVAIFANQTDPTTYPVATCGQLDPDCLGQGGPDCNANDECSDMCDLWCDSLGPEFVQEESGCEGFCQATEGPKLGATCTLHADCATSQQPTINDVSCTGGSVASAHRNACQCECVAMGVGAPSRPGAYQVELGLQIWIEQAGPCDQTDVSIVLEPDCVAFTTERVTGTALRVGDDASQSYDSLPLVGDPGAGCAALQSSGRSGSRLGALSGNFDSAIGDTLSRSTNLNK